MRSRADGFSVNPTRLELKPTQNATALTIANYNDVALFMQIRIYRWERKNGTDLLTEVDGSDAPLITPPLFRLLPGGGSQVVRIGLQKSSAAVAEERQWRVIVEEVPKTSPITESTADAGSGFDPSVVPLSVAIHVRVSLPLFERPQTVRQDLKWSLARAGGFQVTLTAENLGTVTERLDDISLDARDKGSAHKMGPLYIFPGERRSFELQPGTLLPAGNIHMSVQGTPRPLTHELVLSAQ